MTKRHLVDARKRICMSMSQSYVPRCAVALTVAVANVLWGCSAEQGSPAPAPQEDPAQVGQVRADLTGNTSAPPPEHIGVVKIFGAITEQASGVLWQNFSISNPPVTGAFIITAAHYLTDFDEQEPNRVRIVMGSQSANATAVFRSTESDVALIRTNQPFSVFGTTNFTRTLFSLDDSVLANGGTLNCYGYGPTDVLRWGWFEGSGLVGHTINLASHTKPQFAVLQHGDSGGGCFDQNSTLIGVISTGNDPIGGGLATAMDADARSFLNGHRF